MGVDASPVLGNAVAAWPTLGAAAPQPCGTDNPPIEPARPKLADTVPTRPRPGILSPKLVAAAASGAAAWAAACPIDMKDLSSDVRPTVADVHPMTASTGVNIPSSTVTTPATNGRTANHFSNFGTPMISCDNFTAVLAAAAAPAV